MRFITQINEESIDHLKRYNLSGDFAKGDWVIVHPQKAMVESIGNERMIHVDEELGKRLSEYYDSPFYKICDYVDSGHTRVENRANLVVEKIKSIAGENSYDIEEVEPYGPRTQNIYIDNIQMKVYVRFPNIWYDTDMEEIYGTKIEEINVEELSEFHLAKRLILNNRVYTLYKDYVVWYDENRFCRRFYDCFNLTQPEVYEKLISERQEWP